MTASGERSLSRRAAPLLFVSGFCALVYQMVWQRQLRLVFGASTAASAAVIAIFIGGLGIGALWLGRRVDRHPRPLVMYAWLEAIVAGSAALTPLLVAIASKLYLALGGQASLGTFGATALRLVLAAVVLAVPTVAMGGTLPAVARAVETSDDAGRTRLGMLYGINTLGAVVGSLLATFVMLEVFGTRRTLWMAALLNLLLAVLARGIARELPKVEAEAEQQAEANDGDAVPRILVWGAAAVVGFAFFLMEIVWYRVLGPVLGGTVFTFGLILASALLGIGIGGALYGRMPPSRRATLAAFALTCLLEALLVALPFALGDHIALLALLLRSFGLAIGFWGHVMAWTIVAAIVIVPAAIVAGFQFPLLIGLSGSGRAEVGRQVGTTYAANTAGAIVGSLAGGFGLLPLAGALACWRASAGILVVLGVVALALAVRTHRGWRRAIAPGVIALATIAMLFARGPTAVWRHSAIGAGRADAALPTSPNARIAWERQQRRIVLWEQDGVESAVAVIDQFAYAFVINGKIDGNALSDAPTQIMGGLVGAILHGSPKRSLVIGLGTGSTAGWLAAVPGMERVDVVELEPAVLRVAEACAPVNHDVLHESAVHVTIGDAREILLASGDRWDLVFSEPSNPYRAGVSSLFTREYYAAVADHLADDGLFLQWVQAYEVDIATIRTIYATLRSEFPYVTAWELEHDDLLLIGSKRPITYDAAQLRARVASEPYKTALRVAWRTEGLEGFLARHLARPAVGDAVLQSDPELNTDDDNVVEFGFARRVGLSGGGTIEAIRAAAAKRREDFPVVTGDVDWRRVLDEVMLVYASEGAVASPPAKMEPNAAHRVAAQVRYTNHDLAGALAEWRAQDQPPKSLTELEIVAHAMAEAGDDSQPELLAKLRELSSVDADFVVAMHELKAGRGEEATAALERAFVACRADPWASRSLVERAFVAARFLASKDPAFAGRLYRAIREPFSVHKLEEARKATALRIAANASAPNDCVEAAHALEPEFPWEGDLLAIRRDCYAAAGDARAGVADAEMREERTAREGTRFDQGFK